MKFCVFRTCKPPESPECTKPYELLGEMDGIPPKKSIFTEFYHFCRKSWWRAEQLAERENDIYVKNGKSTPSGLRGMAFGATICAYKT